MSEHPHIVQQFVRLKEESKAWTHPTTTPPDYPVKVICDKSAVHRDRKPSVIPPRYDIIKGAEGPATASGDLREGQPVQIGAGDTPLWRATYRLECWKCKDQVKIQADKFNTITKQLDTRGIGEITLDGLRCILNRKSG